MAAVNDKTFIVGIPAIVVGIMLRQTTRVSSFVANAAGGLYCAVADVLIRTHQSENVVEDLLLPDSGGQISYIPLWICGLVWIAVSWWHPQK